MMSHGVHETRILERICVNILAVLRGKEMWETQGFKLNINIKVFMVNTGKVGVSWSRLMENRPQQKGFQILHCLFMKKIYFQVNFFRFWLFSFWFGCVGNK